MKRRTLATMISALIASPPVSHAQQSPIPVIGVLSLGRPDGKAPAFAPFHEGLKESGYIEGRNIAIEVRTAEARYERLPSLVNDLIARKVAVVAAFGTPASLAARQATSTVPVAFASSDPVGFGLVESLGRPGGNATGVSLYIAELTPKRLELLRDLLPNARTVAVLINPAGPTAVSQLNELRSAIRSTGFDLRIVEARTEHEIGQAFTALALQRPDALLVAGDPLFSLIGERIAALAAHNAIAAMFELPELAAAGGLVAYGANLRDATRLVGVYVGKILRGARPADLPVRQPSRFELVINLRTAKALGITIPRAVLERADEVIE